jgi:branched-chain amino acid transport system permease protein
VRGADPNTLLLTSFAMSIMIQALLVIAVSPRPQPVSIPKFLTRVVYLGSVRLGVLDLTTTIVAVITLIGLTMFFRRTKLGISIRAAAEDFETARLMGIRANRVVLAAFAMSGALAGVAALVWIAKIGTVDPVMGLIPMLKAFIAAVLGGLRSLSGPAAGGFLLGVMEVAFQAILPTELLPYGDAFAFTAVVLVLLVRPRGLFVRSQR